MDDVSISDYFTVDESNHIRKEQRTQFIRLYGDVYLLMSQTNEHLKMLK